VLIGAPHTSNWDLFYALWLMQAAGVRGRFVGKDSLFRPPLGILMRWWGGVPVNRSLSSNFVQQMIEVFNRMDEFVLMIAPEGTRSQVDYWKTGFYYIALGAQVPIALAYVDYSTRTLGIGPTLYPSGDIQADFVQIKAFYADKKGKYPEKQGEIRLKPE
jgi:1-acyl-sn-glycerol-3-phosphate acyltransferase